jgi:WD repeat-containing protein 35
VIIELNVNTCDLRCRDLAISLRRKLGDFGRVVTLLKSTAGGSDAQMEEAWNALGDHLVDRHMWYVKPFES